MMAKPKPHTIATVVRVVCDVFGITRSDILSDCRERRYSRPRMVAYYIARRETAKSYPEIGRYFSKDHSSVMQGSAKISNMLDPRHSSYDHDLLEKVSLCRRVLMKFKVARERKSTRTFSRMAGVKGVGARHVRMVLLAVPDF